MPPLLSKSRFIPGRTQRILLGDEIQFVKSQKMSPSILWQPLLIFAMEIILFGCQTNKMIADETIINEETIIPFETIEKNQLSGTGEEYTGTEPKIVVITHPNEIDDAGNWISFDVQEVLQNQDYNQFIVVIVFQGKKPFMVGVEVQKVTARENEVIVDADIFPWSVEHPLPGEISLSPYHIIKIPRTFLLEETKFVLVAKYLPKKP